MEFVSKLRDVNNTDTASLNIFLFRIVIVSFKASLTDLEIFVACDDILFDIF